MPGPTLVATQLDAEQSLLGALQHQLEHAKQDESAARSAVEAAARRLHETVTVVQHAQEAIASFTRYRSLLVPPPALPLDVLAEIIQACTELPEMNRDHHGRFIAPAFAAASVCQRWRDAALSLRSIWSSVFVDFDDLLHIDAFLQLMLQRSGAHPLSVELTNVPVLITQAASPEEATLVRLLERTKDIHVQFQHSDDDMVFEGTILPFFQASMPHLESVTFTGADWPNQYVAPGTQILTLTPKLRILHLCNADLFDLIVPTRIPEMRIFSASSGSLRARDVRVLTRAWPKLEKVTVAVALDPNAGEPIEAPALDTILLMESQSVLPLLRLVRAPNLRELGIPWSQVTFSELVHFLSLGPAPHPFSAVTTVHLSCITAELGTPGVSGCVGILTRLPKVTAVVLSLLPSEAVDALFRLLPGDSCGALESLTFTSCGFDRISAQALLNFLALRYESDAHKLLSLTIDQKQLPNANDTFPAWLKPQLERLVPSVHLYPFQTDAPIPAM